jgi:hypothetical protein
VKAALHIEKETMNDRYLELPVHVGQSRVGTFKYLKERIWQRIQGGRRKCYLRRGRK